MQEEVEALKKQNAELQNQAAEDDTVIAALQESNEELTNEIASLKNNLSAARFAALNAKAQAAQKIAKILQLRKQQIVAQMQKGKVAQTKSKRRSFFRQATRNLQNFTTGKNPVSTIKDDKFNRGGGGGRGGGRDY